MPSKQPENKRVVANLRSPPRPRPRRRPVESSQFFAGTRTGMTRTHNSARARAEKERIEIYGVCVCVCTSVWLGNSF